MKYIDEFRDPEVALAVVRRIEQTISRPWVIMEVCGGQTHSIIRHGLDRLLPEQLHLIHGPGCPVCVTPAHCVDEAIAISLMPDVVFCTFADMLRVPGTARDLLSAGAHGADIRTVYSPLDAVAIARQEPEKQVVFYAIGFETTAPANAMSVCAAADEGLSNFSILVSQVTVPPAIQAIMESPGNSVQGFLAAGHVCTVMGLRHYEKLAETYAVPIVVTGFEPVDILLGIEACVSQLEEGRAHAENCYSRCVKYEGNFTAQEYVNEVFEPADYAWRGLGTLPDSGLALTSRYHQFDARNRFSPPVIACESGNDCRSGAVLTGRIRPDECPHFGGACTPDNPLGATMVSGEGACAAYFRYRPDARQASHG